MAMANENKSIVLYFLSLTPTNPGSQPVRPAEKVVILNYFLNNNTENGIRKRILERTVRMPYQMVMQVE